MIVKIVIHMARCVNCGRRLEVKGKIDEDDQLIGFAAPEKCPHCGEPLQYDVLGPATDLAIAESQADPKEPAPSGQTPEKTPGQESGLGDSSGEGAEQAGAEQSQSEDPAAQPPAEGSAADDPNVQTFLGA